MMPPLELNVKTGILALIQRLRPVLFVLSYLLVLCGVGLGLKFFLVAMLDHAFTADLPWILQGGNYILGHHQLPSHDLFSWSFPHKPWVLYQWLFEVITAFGNQVLGEQGLMRFFIASVMAVYLLIPMAFARCQKIPLAFSLLIGMLALDTITVNISLRPMIISAVALLAQYVMVSQFRLKRISMRWLLIGLALLYLLWGNMHTGVVLGLFSLAIFAIGDALERQNWYQFEPSDPALKDAEPQSLKAFGFMILTGFLASLVNPYGFGIYAYLTHLSGESYLNNIIVELQSPNFHYRAYQFFLLLLTLFILLTGRLKKSFQAQEYLHLFVLTFAMFFVQRFVVWTCLFYALILPQALHRWWMDSQATFPPFMASWLKGFELLRAPLFAILLVVMVGFVAFPQPFTQVSYGKCQAFFKSIRAYQSLKLPSDSLMNDSVIGSCTLLGYPAQKVFIDTRFDFYGERFMREQQMAQFLISDWHQFLDRWHINTLMLEKDKPLIRLLLKNPEYKTLYQDQRVVILRKQM